MVEKISTALNLDPAISSESPAVKNKQGTTEAPGATPFSKELTGRLQLHNAHSVSEEELFAGLIQMQLKELKGDEVVKSYKSMLGVQESTDPSSEDAPKINSSFIPLEQRSMEALAGLTESGKLTTEEVDALYSKAFVAAQLDDDSGSLFDHIGNDSDKTKATSELSLALSAAEDAMKKINSNELTVPPRDLKKSLLEALASSQNRSTTSQTSTMSGAGAAGFLFKPVSESDGNLVVLTPSSIAQNTSGARVVKDGVVLDEGRWGGIGNGNRAHFRFPKPGGSYPDNLSIEFLQNNGTIESFSISDSSVRTE
jgi:hypothetical protein